MKSIALSTIRRQNLQKLLDLLTLAPAMTRQELAERAGLSQMTVTNLVDLLKEHGVLRFEPIQREEGLRPAAGRKAECISLRGDRNAWMLVDISNTRFRLTVMGFDVHPLLELEDDQQGDYLPRLERFLCAARDRLPDVLDGRALLGVAVVAPGPYEIASDTVVNQRLPQLNGVRIKALLQRCLGNHEYYVDEDVKFAVRAFSELIVQQRCEVLYYLYIGEGVGGAAVHGGNMLRGLNATAGDAGHLRDGNGDTYESRLSIPAFLQLLGLDAADSPEKLGEELQRVMRDQPETYSAALSHMAQAAAEMLHGVLWMLDPTHIIIDCAYARDRVSGFIAEISRHLQNQFAGENRTMPEICAAPQGMSSLHRGAIRVLQRAWLERILS